jgi:hypothetical protein
MGKVGRHKDSLSGQKQGVKLKDHPKVLLRAEVGLGEFVLH